MDSYSGRLKFKLEEMIIPSEIHNNIVRFKFSASFNGVKLFLNKALLEQVLDASRVLKEYISDSCIKEMMDSYKKIESRSKEILVIESEAKIKIGILGKYFFIDIYCGRNHKVDDLIATIRRSLGRRKTQLEILRG